MTFCRDTAAVAICQFVRHSRSFHRHYWAVNRRVSSFHAQRSSNLLEMSCDWSLRTRLRISFDAITGRSALPIWFVPSCGGTQWHGGLVANYKSFKSTAPMRWRPLLIREVGAIMRRRFGKSSINYRSPELVRHRLPSVSVITSLPGT